MKTKPFSTSSMEDLMLNAAINSEELPGSTQIQKTVKKREKRAPRKRKSNEKEIMKEYLHGHFVEGGGDNGGGAGAGNGKSRSGSMHMNCAEQFLVDTALYTVTEKMPKVKTKRQAEYVDSLKDNNRKIVIATGPAGTGKTMLACSYCFHPFLLGHYEKLVFTRPLIAVDEELGFLPGTMEEKMAPWVRPMMDVMSQFLTQREIQAMMEEKLIEIVPLGFMRGRTFVNTWVIADEMQNSTPNQMKMLTTRLGRGSRMVITGDLQQCDLILHGEGKNGLDDFLTRMKRKNRCLPSIVHHEFDVEDVQREDVVKDVLFIYSE